MSISAHLTEHLGLPTSVHRLALPGAGGVEVLEFGDRPGPGAKTFATDGLGEKVLSLPGANLRLRQELVFACEGGVSVEEVVLLLGVVAVDVWSSGLALRRGAVLGPRGRLFPESELAALYCAPPVYFPPGLAVCASKEPPVYFVWLVPITVKEADAATRRGFDAFEALFREQDPDLLDLQRAELDLRSLRDQP